MRITSKQSGGVAALALLAATLAVPSALAAQTGEEAQAASADEGQVLTTVVGSAPADLEGLAEGPRIEGFISSREDAALEITQIDGSATNVLLSAGTEIKARGGLFGLGRTELGEQALLDGLPVRVRTVRWNNGLVASEVSFSREDYETAALVRNGTARRFAQQDAAIGENAEGIGENAEGISENAEGISENAAAAEALRGRFGAIDQYNIRSTTNVYFASGRTTLSADARRTLCTAVDEANEIENALILVVGYTDSTGSQEVNQRLSERRAGTVVNYLQQQCGWQPWRMLTPTGMAESGAAATNDTAAGRAQNRRVAVNVLVSKSVDGLQE